MTRAAGYQAHWDLIGAARTAWAIFMLLTTPDGMPLDTLLGRTPVTTFHAAWAARLLYRVMPTPRVLSPLVRQYRKSRGLLLITTGTLDLVLPISWVTSPPHGLLYLGDDLHKPELQCIGRALRGLREREGLVLDVGASIGFHALRMRQFCSKPILSFEPNPLTYALLTSNFVLNQATHPNMEARNVACADVSGDVTLQCGFNSFITDGESTVRDLEGVDLHDLAVAVVAGSVRMKVPVQRLDDLVPAGKRVAFLKVDVEGFEHKVLAGAQEVVRRDKPWIFIELHRQGLVRNGSSIAALCSELRSCGYSLKFFDFAPPEPRSRVARLLTRYTKVGCVQEYPDEKHALAVMPPDSEQLHVLATQ